MAARRFSILLRVKRHPLLLPSVNHLMAGSNQSFVYRIARRSGVTNFSHCFLVTPM